MANYVITAPDGKKYRVSGQGSKEEALKALQGRLGATTAEPAQQEGQVLGIPPELLTINRKTPAQAFQQLDDSVRMFADGASFGYGDKLSARMGELAGGPSYEQGLAAERAKTKAASERTGGGGDALEMIGSMIPMGKIAAIGSKAIPAIRAIPGIGNAAAAAAPYVGNTALGGAAGAAYAGGHDQDVAEGAKYGAAFGLAGALGGKALEKVVSPNRSTSAREQMVKLLKGEGVDVTAGQRTGSKALRYREGELGGNAADAFMERQGDQFTAAALKRVGTTANRATPDVVDDAFNRIGGEFSALSSRNRLVADPQIAQDLTQVAMDYGSVVAPNFRAPVVERTINETINMLRQNGFMDGRAYQHHASRLRTLARKTTDPELKGALNGIVEALDGAMERSISRFNPGDAGAWSQARRQYRNLMVIEQAATGAGEKAAAGIVTPAKLRQATVTKHGRRNYARGKGDFADLARAGEEVMTPLPDSGTSSRLKAQMLPHLIGMSIGAGAGGQQGGWEGAVAGGAAGTVAPWMIGRAMLSAPGRAYLGNQSKVSPQIRALMARGLIAGGISNQ